MRLLASLACLSVLCGCAPPHATAPDRSKQASPSGTPIQPGTVGTEPRVSARDKMQERQPELPVIDVGHLLPLADHLPDANELPQLRFLAEGGDPNAQCRLAWYYCCHTKDANETLKWFRKASEQGHGEAEFILFFAYSIGLGTPANMREGVNWLFKAANDGYAKAQFELGASLEENTPPNHVEAAKWYQKAAEQGYAKAQHNLGRMYHVGEGVQQDDGEAAKWYRKAADQGHAQAQCKLGILYDKGNGVRQNSGEAVKWYRRAAQQGDPIAQHLLAGVYWQGSGVIEDYVEAYKWAVLAALNGRDTMALREEIRKSLSPVQIAEAQRQAREFVARKESEADRNGH